MIVRNASAKWNGPLTDGTGSVKLGSGVFEGPYSFKSRTADGPGTNPEELLGAAHAGCYTMMLSALLSQRNTPPKEIRTTAKVTFDKVGEGFGITKIELNSEAEVPGLSSEEFLEVANKAKTDCPVSKALAGVEITLNAKLNS